MANEFASLIFGRLVVKSSASRKIVNETEFVFNVKCRLCCYDKMPLRVARADILNYFETSAFREASTVFVKPNNALLIYAKPHACAFEKYQTREPH